MKEELFENPVEVRTYVPTPHFEDWRVVQRAQRVVPLDVIRLKLRVRRLLFLGGALAVAIVLGAASALLAVQIKRVSAPAQISQIDEPVEEPDATMTAAAAEPLPVQEDPDPAAESTVVEETPLVNQPARPAPKRPETLASRPRIVSSHRDSRSVRQPSEEEQLEQIREAVLYEQWQERRTRRAARRERRNRADDRDLSRVDEIFEGPRRRPERPY